MAGSMVYRLPVAEATAAHMVPFVEAMRAAQAISDNRGYNFIAGFHGAPGNYCWHHQISRRTPLQARLFLPWHRAYLWWLEQALQDLHADVAIPWWDWTAASTVPAAFAVARLAGQANPLAGSRINVPSLRPPISRRTRRAPGRTPGVSLPTTGDVDAVLDDSDWASFSDRVESIHDEVHVWVGGDMQDITTAAYDPIFFAHHCMIDRLWYLWQVRHGPTRIPPELLDLPLAPFGKAVKDVLDVQAMGYEYAASSTPLPVAAATGGGHA